MSRLFHSQQEPEKATFVPVGWIAQAREHWKAFRPEMYERLKKAGVEVTAPRPGRRPGSHVFSVQSHTANVPTIVIGGIGRW